MGCYESDLNVAVNLRDRIIYVENDCNDIWDWSEKVYRIIEQTADSENQFA